MSRPGGGARYVCDRCGRDLSGQPLSVPCLCGGFERRRIDPGGAVFRRPAAATPLPWDPFKDWTVKYMQLTWNVAQLGRLYATGTSEQGDEMRAIAGSTFAACLQLGDWLASGPEPAAVVPGDVARLVEKPPLALAAALVQPAQGEEGPSARLLPVAFARQPRYWVEYEAPRALPVRYDALDLAQRCLGAWQEFLTDRGVPLPDWQS